MIVNEIYDNEEPEDYEHMHVFREALLPFISDDAVVDIEYIGSRYDISIRSGRFKDVSFLGYYHDNYISIELKSKQAFYQLYELFPQSTFPNFDVLNENIQRFKFLHAFAFGCELNISKINSLDDMMEYFRHDGDNYSHLIREKNRKNSCFSIGMGLGIQTNPIQLKNEISYNYYERMSSTDFNYSFKIHESDFFNFEEAFIKRYITERLGIEKDEVILKHSSLLKMLTI